MGSPAGRPRSLRGNGPVGLHPAANLLYRTHMADTFNIPELAGKVVLVTGSSRGIGAGMVRAFAKCGARCVVNYVTDPQGRNKADAEQVAAEIGVALIAECDVSDYAQVGRVIDRVGQELGGLDVLVNNAG